MVAVSKRKRLAFGKNFKLATALPLLAGGVILTGLLNVSLFFVDESLFHGDLQNVRSTTTQTPAFSISVVSVLQENPSESVTMTTTTTTTESASIVPVSHTATKHQKQKPPPAPASSSTINSSSNQNKTDTNTTEFSACLLIKDDNAILNEWIAYHYHVLNLRHILVAVDPSSATSPSTIWQTWRNLTDLTVTEWTDTDFMPQTFLKKGYHINPRFINADANKSAWHNGDEDAATVKADRLQISNHRFRQVTFLSSCLRQLKKEKRTWVMHIDTDEYIVVNPMLRRQEQTEAQLKQSQLLRKSSRYMMNVQIPPLAEPNSIETVLQQIQQDAELQKKANYPCISMPRLLFGSVERNESYTGAGTSTAANTNASFFNTTLFETMRWKYHAALTDKERNAQPKVMVDVSAVPQDDEMFHVKAFSIHRPSKKLCRRIDQLTFDKVEKYPLTVNHYVGARERYVARKDTRRNERAYEYKAHVDAGGSDDWITTWLDGFVRKQGPEKASALLQDYAVVPTQDSSVVNSALLS
jgi:hypothetical protein